MTQAPVLSAIVKFLADGGIARVWGVELPRSEEDVMQTDARANVVVLPVGGTGGIGARSYIPVHSWLYEIRCYDRTPYLARQLGDQVYDLLKFMKPNVVTTDEGDDVYLRVATIAGGPIAFRDVDADWPFDLRTYEITADERIVA